MSDIFSLHNKAIIVTGGTGILGKAFVEAIAAHGASVGVLGRNKIIAEERAHAIESAGGKAIPLIADVTNEDALKAANKTMLDQFGKIDGLVNAAGGNMPEAIVENGDDVFALNMNALDQVMKLNLWGTVLPTQVFGKTIAQNKSGSIVNISSVSAGSALTKVLGYSLGKAAIDSYTKWMAIELANRYGDAMRMNAIMPGFFLTEQNKNLLTDNTGNYTDRGQLIIQQTPFKRMGDANELKGALLWLLSDASKFVTGTIVTVDGGFSAFSGV